MGEKQDEVRGYEPNREGEEDQTEGDVFVGVLVVNKSIISLLKEKLIFLHIKPYNKDIYKYTQCSTALL